MVGGFHSPLEQSVLRLLLEGNGTAVVVLARSVAAATLPSTWSAALGAGGWQWSAGQPAPDG